MNDYSEFSLQGIAPKEIVDYFKPNDYFGEMEWNGFYFTQEHFAMFYNEATRKDANITDALYITAINIWLKDNDIDWLDVPELDALLHECLDFCVFPSEVFEFLDNSTRINTQIIHKEEE